jgi:hypothetical protein
MTGDLHGEGDAKSLNSGDKRCETIADESPFLEQLPMPNWRGSKYRPAIVALEYGSVGLLADLLEGGEPIPPEAGKIIAAALRGGTGLPYRLVLFANPKAGQKRAGRWPEYHALRDMVLAEQMHKRMVDGTSYDKAAEEIADAYGIGERTVKAAYSRYRDILSSYRSDFAANLELSAVRDESPLHLWMLKGDELEDEPV